VKFTSVQKYVAFLEVSEYCRIIRHRFVIVLTKLESSGVFQVHMFRPSLLEADIDLEVDAIVGERFHADAAGQQRVLQIEADVGVEGVGEVRLVPWHAKRQHKEYTVLKEEKKRRRR
jgi:hypothetical protein